MAEMFETKIKGGLTLRTEKRPSRRYVPVLKRHGYILGVPVERNFMESYREECALSGHLPGDGGGPNPDGTYYPDLIVEDYVKPEHKAAFAAECHGRGEIPDYVPKSFEHMLTDEFIAEMKRRQHANDEMIRRNASNGAEAKKRREAREDAKELGREIASAIMAGQSQPKASRG